MNKKEIPSEGFKEVFNIMVYGRGRKVCYYLYCSGAHVPQHVDAASSLFSRTAYCLGKKSVVWEAD